jgi:hypothetical protein
MVCEESVYMKPSKWMLQWFQSSNFIRLVINLITVLCATIHQPKNFKLKNFKFLGWWIVARKTVMRFIINGRVQQDATIQYYLFRLKRMNHSQLKEDSLVIWDLCMGMFFIVLKVFVELWSGAWTCAWPEIINWIISGNEGKTISSILWSWLNLRLLVFL